MINVVRAGEALKTTAEIIGAVTTVVGAADSLREAAQPVMESDSAKAVVAKGKNAFGGLLQKAAETKDSAGSLAEKAVNARSSFDEAQRAKKREEGSGETAQESQANST